MSKQLARMPQWLTTDLLILIIGTAVIGIVVWIAP